MMCKIILEISMPLQFRYLAFACILLLQCVALNASAVSKTIALNTIKSASDFEQLSAEPDSSTTARTATLKFMLDRKNKRKLWFFNTKNIAIIMHSLLII